MSDSSPTTEALDQGLQRAFAQHPRTWRDFELVYPVISRRSNGISLGVNLNPDKICNFNCLYCCVDRTRKLKPQPVDPGQLRAELNALITMTQDGTLAEDPLFSGVPADYRRLRDIAFSGDGEPTLSPVFEQAVDVVIEARTRAHLHGVKIVLITNATRLDRPEIERVLERLDGHGGEVWAKLDAGTPEFFALIDQPRVSLEQVLAGIRACAAKRAVVIQTMVAAIDGQVAPDAEWQAWADRLAEVQEGGGRISRVQIYTVARGVSDPRVSPAPTAALERIAQIAHKALPGLNVEVFPGVG